MGVGLLITWLVEPLAVVAALSPYLLLYMVGLDGGRHRGRTPRIVLALAVSALAGGVGAVICLLLVLVLGLTASLLAGRATSPLAIYAGC